MNPTDTLTSVDRDQNSEIRYCLPKAKTTSFTLVLSDGQTFKLDSAGNTQAAAIVRQNRQKIALFGSRNRRNKQSHAESGFDSVGAIALLVAESIILSKSSRSEQS